MEDGLASVLADIGDHAVALLGKPFLLRDAGADAHQVAEALSRFARGQGVQIRQRSRAAPARPMLSASRP